MQFKIKDESDRNVVELYLERDGDAVNLMGRMAGSSHALLRFCDGEMSNCVDGYCGGLKACGFKYQCLGLEKWENR